MVISLFYAAEINNSKGNTVMANNFKCICGFTGNPGHAGRCKLYRNEIARVETSLKSYITEYYTQTYSITDCCRYVKEKECTQIRESALRLPIKKWLDSLGIRESFDGDNFNKFRQVKIQKTIFDRYGVINIGQLPGRGIGEQNLIPYKKVAFDEDMANYKLKVRSLTDKIFNKLKKSGHLPLTCFYTGIEFADVSSDKVNPNDPFKRTIDHRVSLTESYFRGWPAEKAASLDNLAFCLRIVNITKSNTTENDFKRLILPLLKQRLKNENKSNY